MDLFKYFRLQANAFREVGINYVCLFTNLYDNSLFNGHYLFSYSSHFLINTTLVL